VFIGRFLRRGRSAKDGGDLAPDNPGKPSVHRTKAQFIALARAANAPLAESTVFVHSGRFGPAGQPPEKSMMAPVMNEPLAVAR
jgi:hypothetical protein